MKETWKIYFVRHWQTDRNINSQMNPWDIDSELNKTGIIQAITAWKKAKENGLSFDIIVSSPLVRAADTAKIIAKETWYNSDIIFDERLKEQIAWELKNHTHDQIRKEFNVKETEEVRRIYKVKKYNKIEDIVEFSERIIESYNEVLEKYKWKNILFVWHSWTGRVIFMNSQNIDFDEAMFKISWIPNSVIMDITKKIEKV